MQDPFARVIRGREKFGAPVSEDEHAVRCGFLSEKEYDWKEDTAPQIPYNEMILYKVHVRGYTKQAELSPRKKGTFAGLVEMIPYWKEMGINAIELMPAYEFQECTRKETAGSMAVRSKKDDRINYWGYAQGFYFAAESILLCDQGTGSGVSLIWSMHCIRQERVYHGDVFPGEYAVLAGSAFPLDVETVLSCGWISSYGRWRSSESP